MNNHRARVIAFYLPQYHPIPENDEWWGRGFTEWTAVANAKPLFKGHYQPHIPSELGFYDLRISEVREAQAKLAQDAGIEGFCYWHYWFGGSKRLLERPFNEVLKSGKPDFPFCLGWANHPWFHKLWDPKGKDILLIDQKYLGVDDYKKHFYEVLLPAFNDKRYILVDDKPLFVIYSLTHKDEIKTIIETWQALATENGLKGIYFVGAQRKETKDEILKLGFNAVYRIADMLKVHSRQSVLKKVFLLLRVKFFNSPRRYSFKDLTKYLYNKEDYESDTIPIIVPNFDHTPRSGTKGVVITHTSPKLFREQVKTACSLLKNKEKDHQLLFLISWNEWGEGNYLEPDEKYGAEYLRILFDVKCYYERHCPTHTF